MRPPWFLSAPTFMYIVGDEEIIAGIAVAARPRSGSLPVAAWLLGIILNLLILGRCHDVTLRDFDLFGGALARYQLSPAGYWRRPGN